MVLRNNYFYAHKKFYLALVCIIPALWCKAYSQLRANECLDVRTLKTKKFFFGIRTSKCFKDFPALLLCGLPGELLIREQSSPALKDSGPEETLRRRREDVKVNRDCPGRFPKDCHL